MHLQNLFSFLYKNRNSIGTIFLKDTDSTDKLITELEELKLLYQNSDTFPNKDYLEKELKSYTTSIIKGRVGENNIIHYLRYSDINMYVLHDVYLKKDDLSSQIDFLLITEKYIYIIESKWRKSNTEFELKENGDIISHLTQNGTWTNERYIESNPFIQNNEHRFMLNKIIENNPLLSKYISDKNIIDIVVLSNPQTTIYVKKAPQELSSKLIRLNDLIDYIKITNSNSHLKSYSSKQMEMIGQELLTCLSTNNIDYTTRFKEPFVESYNISYPTDEELITLLKLYRKIQAKKEYPLKGNYAQFFRVYSDHTLYEIVELRPQTLEELSYIFGIGEIKLQKYGEDILQIINGEIPDCLKNQL